MSNLLPKEERKAVWRMYRTRFLIIADLLAVMAALLFAASLVPSYLALQIEASAHPAGATASSANTKNNASEINDAAQLVSAISPLMSATTTPTQVIAEALSKRPSGISITHINFTSASPDTLIVSGSSDSTETINNYTNTLQADPMFTSVSVPVGDLAGTESGQFSITLSGNF